MMLLELVKELEELRRYKEETSCLTVETPAGNITAEPYGAPIDYPGLRILVNDIPVAFVEYDNVKGVVHVCTYDHTSEEPRDVYNIVEPV